MRQNWILSSAVGAGFEPNSQLARISQRAYFSRMSIEMLQTEVTTLSSEQRRKLMSFMVALDDRGRPDYATELARKIDDKSRDGWLTPEQCERELGLDSK